MSNPPIIENGKVNMNLAPVQGDYYDFVIEFFTDAAGTVEEDITDSTFDMTVYTDDGYNNRYATFSIGSGLTIEAPNRLKISLTDTQVNTIKPSTYYKIKRIYPDSKIKTRFYGIINPTL